MPINFYKNIYLTFLVISILFTNCKKKDEPISILQITNAAYSSSSVLENNQKRYGHENLKMGGPGSWCEGSKGNGVGEFASIQSEDSFYIDHFFIKNGFGEEKYFSLNNRVKVLEVKGDTESEEVNISDQNEIQEIKLKKKISGKEIKFIIKDIYKGSKFEDTCIHKLTFTNESKSVEEGSDEEIKLTSVKCQDINNEMFPKEFKEGAIDFWNDWEGAGKFIHSFMGPHSIIIFKENKTLIHSTYSGRESLVFSEFSEGSWEIREKTLYSKGKANLELGEKHCNKEENLDSREEGFDVCVNKERKKAEEKYGKIPSEFEYEFEVKKDLASKKFNLSGSIYDSNPVEGKEVYTEKINKTFSCFAEIPEEGKNFDYIN
ncbi:MAG: hypothetical protein KDK36_14135 [Leptospiraceae bacterium]|nr:hypothetical protein [Leptospiraceae bacterium]